MRLYNNKKQNSDIQGNGLFSTILKLNLYILLLTTVQFDPMPGSGQVSNKVTNSSPELWFKSNQGVLVNNNNYVEQWNDVSDQSNVIAQPAKTANGHVLLRMSGANYNPTVFFDGETLERLKGSANNMGGTPTIFSVSRCNSTDAFNPIFSNFENNPSVRNAELSKQPGPGLYINYNYYIADGYGSWITSAANAAANDGQLDIMTTIYGAVNSTARSEIYQNGNLSKKHTGVSVPVYPGKKTIEIGGRYGDDPASAGRIFKGDIAEIIYFADPLPALERQKIESYLAIKYGITLSTSYLSSDRDTIYDQLGFSERIIGIGRDDALGLHQKQAKGENYEPVLQIALATMAIDNNNNTAGFKNDKAFVIAGDNNGDLVGIKSSLLTDIQSCLERKWKIQVSGAAANDIFFQMPQTPLSLLSGNGDIQILFTADQNFVEPSKTYKMKIVDGNYMVIVPFLSIGTQYFTFVRK